MAAVAILLPDDFWYKTTECQITRSELIHKPFVWAYWLVGSLTAGRLFSMVAAGRRQVGNWGYCG